MEPKKNSQENYQKYVLAMQKIQDLNSATALLHWDAEVNAPTKGAARRASQIATLTATAHEWTTAAELEELINTLYETKNGLSENEAANITLSWEHLQKAKKLSTAFVAQFSTIKSAASNAWVKARKAKDFSLFVNELEALIDQLKQKAALIGYEEHPYDALLDEYEKGMTVAKLDVLFEDVQQQLVAFAKQLRTKGEATENTFLDKDYDEDEQWKLGLFLLEQMGYDFEAGRQDKSVHPFTMSLSATDVRVTTRILRDKPLEMISSCIHEGGHGLYEQGLKDEYYGLPMGMATSLGIHESQSRIWENNVGLSHEYWQANFLRLQQQFPAQLQDITLERFYKAINQVKPNLIRIQADEIHYHLHILIRYQLEKGLIEGSIAVKDLDTVWNKLYQDYMGVAVPDSAQGVLQDIHWSEALFGYFPTYSLGSLYAAQFFAQAEKDLPNLKQEIAQGNLTTLRTWLNENIHQYGQKYTSEELCKRITGEGLNFEYFMKYVNEKYSTIYGL